MNQTKTFEGVFNLGKNNIAYITDKTDGQVVEIPVHLHNGALHKDIVRVRVTNAVKNEGEIVEIIRRSQSGFVGILKKENSNFVVVPDNYKIPTITLENNTQLSAHTGESVFVVITKYQPTLVGTVQKFLGKATSNDAHMNGIALEQGFDYTFPENVEEEAQKLEEQGIQAQDRKSRRDMRETLTFTIDPQDAKDFDDALSFVVLPNGNYEIGIHIADVAHYVQPESAIDTEAQKRTTSVYLVDRTIPMLPEQISNGLCSLRPDEDKLAFSVVLEINPKTGDIINEWFGRTIIRSNKRFTYEEAQEIIDTQKGIYVNELLSLNTLAKIYTQQRHDKGSLDFETHEVKFVLDDEGVPLDVKVKERIDTNKLIEEFMLLANNRVAEYMQKAPFFVYRVHGKPERERMEKLRDFLKLLDYTTELVDDIIPVKTLQKIIKDAEGKPVYDTLQTAIVRSMQKANYTTQNIGHFGLAFKHYTHFTSPIRRYPDVLAHRLLYHALQGTTDNFDQEWYEKMCSRSSDQEVKAVTAERNSIKLKQVEYMKTKNPDDILNGVVTGAGKFGLFVAESHSLSEGMIRMSDLGNDHWEFREASGSIVGKRTQKIFKLGDRIQMKIKHIDLEKRLIDYGLVLNGISQIAPPRAPFQKRSPHKHAPKKPL